MDRYTKSVLTVIAAALCALVAQNAVGPAQSQQGPQPVVICSADGINCADVVGRGVPGIPSDRGALTVQSSR